MFSIGSFLAIVLITLVAAFIASLDWSQIGPRLGLLLLLLGVLYWATTLLPGPIKKVGRAATKAAFKTAKKDDKRR